MFDLWLLKVIHINDLSSSRAFILNVCEVPRDTEFCFITGQQAAAVPGAPVAGNPVVAPNVSLPLSSDPTNTAMPATTASTTATAAQQQVQAVQQTVQNIFTLNDSQTAVRSFF